MTIHIDVLSAPSQVEEVLPFYRNITEVLRSEGSRESSRCLVIARNTDDIKPLQGRLESAAETEHGRQVLRDAALIVQTSGSTSGRTSLVALSADAMRAGADATHRVLGGPGTWVVALPLQHIAGIQMLVRAAAGNVDPVVPEGWPRFSPNSFAAAIRQAHAESARVYASLVSAQLDAVLSSGPDVVQSVASLNALLVGGGRIAPSLLDRAKAAGVPVHTTYGMTETSGGCVYDGVPLPGTKIKVESETGRVLLSTPALMDGYVDQETEWVNVDCERYFRTSDTGWLTSDGTLQIRGRVDEVIKSGGVKISTAQVTDVLEKMPEVREVFCIGIEDEVWGESLAALVVGEGPRIGVTDLAETLRARVRDELGNSHLPRTVVIAETLPRTSIGKVSIPAAREVIADAIRSGTAWRR